ncbi:MAG: 6-phosphofructokinase [Bacteroidetes bacterium]|nr:6-phosphofructokinase [Bacteroidota bacterium]
MKKIGVFTSGGDSPGMNACIRAVVRSAGFLGVEVIGIKRGYQGMIDGEFVNLENKDVANIIQNGGTILKTARCQAFLTPEGRKIAYDNIVKQGIEGLVCIGGNGTYTGAGIFNKEFNIPSIGAPGTIDNDLYGTDYTIGFDTAVNTALAAIDKIRDTADAHNRVFFIEVMGRDSGFIALNSALSGGAEGVLVPEILGDYDSLMVHFSNKTRRNKEFSIIVVAEGETHGSTFELADKFKKQFINCDVRVSILGHIQRGGSPTANDRILASQLGNAAVENLLAGKTNMCVGVVNHEIVLTNFDEAVNNKKNIDKNLWHLVNILSY